MSRFGKSAMRQQNNLKNCCCIQALLCPIPFVSLSYLTHPLHCLWQVTDSCLELIQPTDVLKKGASSVPPGGKHLDLGGHTWADAGWAVAHVVLGNTSPCVSDPDLHHGQMGTHTTSHHSAAGLKGQPLHRGHTGTVLPLLQI